MKVADESYIRTTVNIRHDFSEIIIRYAQRNNMEPSSVIRYLLKRQIKTMSRKIRYAEHAMRYQERGCRYTPMHVSLTAVEYSRFRDVMLCCRFSLSLIFSLAMESFEKLMGIISYEDSYPEDEYMKLHVVKNNIDIFINMWGNPSKPPT